MNAKQNAKVFFVMLIALSFASCSSKAPKTELPLLHAEGKNLRTQDGELINLRGTNIGGCFLQEFWMTPTSQSTNIFAESDIYSVLEERFGKKGRDSLVKLYQTSYFTEEDFDLLASLGANCIRLPFWWRNIADEKGRLKSNAFEQLDWFVEQASERGMYVILDMHGVPGSQNGSDHSGVDGLNAKKEASKFFFGDDAQYYQKIYYSLWKKIAEHYKDCSAVAGYDIMNEPFCTYRYNAGISAFNLHEILWAIYDETYRVIRGVDSNHIIVFEATWDPVDLPNPDDYGWKNVMYEYHNYLYDDYANVGGRQISNMQKKLDLIAKADYNVPSYMGEFSYFTNLDTWEEGLNLLNQAGINWTTWTYKTVEQHGNWGLVHHPNNLGGINLEFLSEDEIRAQWSRVGERVENTGLMLVFKKYTTMPFVGME